MKEIKGLVAVFHHKQLELELGFCLEPEPDQLHVGRVVFNQQDTDRSHGVQRLHPIDSVSGILYFSNIFSHRRGTTVAV
jgi:hypothetical protein